MAVDITLLFKASVKTVKTRNKALGVPLGGGGGGSSDDALLLKRGGRPRSDFSGRAREVVNNIGKLKDFLLQHRKDYINAYSHAMTEYVRMTDTERDQIDQDAQIFMRTCADAIQQLRTEAHKDIHSPQVKQHREAVLDFIGDYLKRVCKLYSEQRAIRVKRVVDKKRLSRLEPEQSNKSKTTSSSEITVQTSSGELEEKSICEISKDKNVIDEHANSGLWGDGKGEDELSPEEIQMFEQENQRLVGEMNSLFDEVRQIEGKVVEISRLQEIFTEKVLQQVKTAVWLLYSTPFPLYEFITERYETGTQQHQRDLNLRLLCGTFGECLNKILLYGLKHKPQCNIISATKDENNS